MVNYDKLAELYEQRLRFRATVEEVEYGGSHIRISNIINVETGLEVCTYLRLRYCKNFKELELEEGDVIEFDARVVMRMYYGRPMKSIRYKLDKPTKCVKVMTAQKRCYNSVIDIGERDIMASFFNDYALSRFYKNCYEGCVEKDLPTGWLQVVFGDGNKSVESMRKYEEANPGFSYGNSVIVNNDILLW